MQNHTTIDSPPPPSIHIARVDSPIGRIELTRRPRSPRSPSSATATCPTTASPRPARRSSTRQSLNCPNTSRAADANSMLPVTLGGTDFQRSVWRELTDIPFGEVVSYREIGMATGRPTAGRAVGGAVGANPVPIIIPCHRVLASNGRITGYSGGNGIPTKEWLLDHEGIEHR